MKTRLKVNFKRTLALLVVSVLLLSTLHLGLGSLADAAYEEIVIYNPVNDITYTTANLTSEVKPTDAIGDTVGFTYDNASGAAQVRLKNVTVTNDFKNYDAIVFKARVTNKISPSFAFPTANGSGYANYVNANYITFNALTGVVSQTEGITSSLNLTISDDVFEGYIIALIDDEMTIKDTPWSDYIDSHLETGFTLGFRGSSDALAVNFNGWQVGEVSFVKGVEAFIESVKNYVPKPTLSYTGKTVFANQEIRLATGYGDFGIYYTLDGSTPTIDSTKYDVNTPVKITADCTLKAVAYRDGNYSEIVSHEYVVYNEGDYKTAILQDGSSNGKVSQPTNQAVTPNVNGISPDDNCVEIKLLDKSVAPFTPTEVVYNPVNDLENTKLTKLTSAGVKPTETIGDTLGLTYDGSGTARLISKDISVNENFKDYKAMAFKVRITNKSAPNFFFAKTGSGNTSNANAINTKYITVNTLTGTVRESNGRVNASQLEFSDDVFEGYIIAVIDDETTITFASNNYTWDSWLEENNSTFNLWIRHTATTAANFNGWQIGEVSFIDNLDMLSSLYVETESAALSTTNITAEEIETAYFWMSNPKGNGSMQLLFGSHIDGTLHGFTPGKYYLVDATTATYQEFVAAEDFIEIPDGFIGYVLFETKTSAGINEIVANNYATLTLQYKLPDMDVGDAWYYDNITVSTKETKFTAMQLAEDCVPTPYVKTITQYARLGDAIELFAEDGADIYYTIDGTKPTTASTKYNAANPIIVNSDITIRAIAVVDGEPSVPISFEYKLIDPNTPNFTVINDGTDSAKFTNSLSANTSLVDNVSPNGSAYNISIKSLGTGNITVTMDTIDTDFLIANNAFAFWVRVPANKTITLSPSFVTGTNYFTGKITTIDTDDGTVTTNENSSMVELAGFEGYVLLEFDDKTTIGDKIWHEFLRETKLTSLVIGVDNKEIMGIDIAFDNFGYILDYDKFVTDINSNGLRPDAPYSLIAPGMVIEGKNLMLYAGDGTDIYYTLDGTTPTTASTRFEIMQMGNAQGDFSPIDITTDLSIKMIAVRDGVSSGVTSYDYTIDPKYTGPDSVILNNGSGEGLNTVTYSATDFDYSLVDDATEDGHAFKFEFKDGVLESGKTKNEFIRLKLNPDEVVSPMQIKAFSIHLEVPASEEGASNYRFRHAGDGNGFQGQMFAIGDDGVVIQCPSNLFTVKDGFKGTILLLLNEKDTVSVNYGAYMLDMESYVKSIGFAENTFTFYVQNYRPDLEYVILDNLTAYYDAQKALEAFNIEGLLADYSINTYENANMMVSNDCSGAKIYSGLNAFSETLTVKSSDVSKDNRNIELTFGKGESFIEFSNYCKDEAAVMSEGIAFWAEVPKGCGNTAVSLKINEAHQELFSYGSQYHHYLIDVDGVISRVEGDIILPDGFRGWIVIPNNSTIVLEESVEFNNARIDFNNIASTSIIFKNENDALLGKTVYIDDISWYTDFAKLVQSRAYSWAGQVFEN